MIIALNNKSNLDKNEFKNYIKKLYQINTAHKLIVCPSFLNISSVDSKKIILGAQDVSAYGQGPHTGEVSAPQLKSYGVSCVIVGHSERREEKLETDDEIRQKLKNCLSSKMAPILCVGETLKERDKNLVTKVLRKELTTATKGLTEDEKSHIVIAYEPIWSIGTGVTPTNDQIKSVITMIKGMLPHCKVLYGGSVTEENIDTLKEIKEIDGYLIGGLSLKPEKLIEFLNKIK